MTRDVQRWINTYTGRKFYPLDPHIDDIDIADIAHALSLQCRFTGHIKYFYSVAQHSLLVASKCPPELALEGLLHDASEAYLVDLARPVKHQPELEAYRDAEARLEQVIAAKFGLKNHSMTVKCADNRALATEAVQLLPNLHEDWQCAWNWQTYPPYTDVVIQRGIDPAYIELLFVNLFHSLMEARSNAAA
jgi:uncharacterized protein